MRKPKRAIIFDLDGTLVDSTSSGLEKIRTILAANGIGYSPEKESALLEGWGLATSELLCGVFGVSVELAGKMSEEWENAGTVPPMFPGVDEMFSYAKENELALVLMTSRSKPNGMRVLNHHRCLDQFSLVEELGSKEFKKPDLRVFIEPLTFLKEVFNITREECLYVGDTIVDVRCGVAAGVETILVLSGPCTPEIAMAHGVHSGHVIDSIASLPTWIDSHK